MKRIVLASSLAAALLATVGVAQASVCENHTASQERRLGIPAHLLSAITRAESGVETNADGTDRAWPWTVTSSEGAVDHPSKWAAIQAVEDLQRRGVAGIKVGCMQIDLHHHGHAFRSLNVAFEPAYNVAYGARLLVSHYQRSGDWRQAVAHYHSADPAVSGLFQARVEELWQQARHDGAYGDLFAAEDPETLESALANAWDRARVWVDAHAEPPFWARDGWHRRFEAGWPHRSYWAWRWSWRGDGGDADAQEYRIWQSGPWRSVGTTVYN